MRNEIINEIKQMQKLMVYNWAKTDTENTQIFEQIIGTPPDDSGGGNTGGNTGGNISGANNISENKWTSVSIKVGLNVSQNSTKRKNICHTSTHCGYVLRSLLTLRILIMFSRSWITWLTATQALRMPIAFKFMGMAIRLLMSCHPVLKEATGHTLKAPTFNKHCKTWALIHSMS